MRVTDTGGMGMTKTKSLSFSSIILLGINGIVGSGIFLLPGTLYRQSGMLSIVAILMAGFSTLLIAMNYAVMASKIDAEGGAYAYASRAFGPLGGFQTGWFGWLLGVITISAEIAAFQTVLKSVLVDVHGEWIFDAVGMAIILLLVVINISGTDIIKIFDNLSSAIKVSLLIAFIIVGVWLLSKTSVAVPQATPVKASDFTGTFSTAFYMFTGFSFLLIAAKQMTNPEKTIPRALIISISTVGIIYAAVQFILILLQRSSLAGDTMPIATVFNQVFGIAGRMVVLVGIMISTIGVALAVSFDTTSDLASLSSDEHLLPAIVGKTTKNGSALVSIILTMWLAALLILSGSYLFLVKLIVLSSFVQYLATIGSLIKLRNDKSLPKGMQIPFGLAIPIISIIIIVYLMFSFNWISLALAAGAAIIGGVIYCLNAKNPAKAK